MKTTLRAVLLGVSIGLAGTLGIAIPAFAQESVPTGGQGHEQAVKNPSGKFVQDLGDRAIKIMAEKNLTLEARKAQFRQILKDSFDLQTIGRFVIGRSWNAATPEQQKEYMTLFEELVVKTYGDRMSLYTGEGFEVINARPESEKDTIVNSHITHPDGSKATDIDWRVRQRDGKIGIIDVVVEGVSLSVTQRQEYASVIQRNDGKIDGLIDLMRQQVNGAAKVNTPSQISVEKK